MKIKIQFLNSCLTLFLLLTFFTSAIHAGVNDGLQVYFQFDDNVDDSGPHGLVPTVSNINLIDGKVGKALEMDSLADRFYFRMPDVSTNYSFSFWIKLYTKTSEHVALSMPNLARTVRLAYFTAYPIGSSSWHYGSTVDNKWISGLKADTDGLPLNTWIHFMYILRHGEILIYRNGTIFDKLTITDVPLESLGALDIFIGTTHQNYQWLNGAVDEFRFYNRVVSPEEIKSLSSPDSRLALQKISGNATEEGGQVRYSLSLSVKPKNAVTIDIVSLDTGEVIPVQSSATFLESNWEIDQIIVFQGVDDNFSDGDQSAQIRFSSSNSADAGYAALAPQTISILNQDNDVASLAVKHVSGELNENGGTEDLQIRLNTQPNGDVIVIPLAEDSSEVAVVSPTSMTFTQNNWAGWQTLRLRGIDDQELDGDTASDVLFSVAPNSVDSTGYKNLAPLRTTVTNKDNDVPAILITPPSVVSLTEGGLQAFDVSLGVAPKGNVIVNLSVNSTGLTLSRATATFTTSNWNNKQSITLTSTDNNILDGDRNANFTAIVDGASSIGYRGVQNSVLLTVEDNETPTIQFANSVGAASEDGGQMIVPVRLLSVPTKSITVNLSAVSVAGAADNITVEPSSLSFTPNNALASQNVLISTFDDDVNDGNISFTLTASIDENQAEYPAPSVSHTSQTIDNDTAGIAKTLSGNIGENGNKATIGFRLTSEPTANVVISANSSNVDEVNVSGPVTFTPQNWASIQNITVSSVDDELVDGDISVSIGFDVSAAGDTSGYQAMLIGSENLLSVDNDTPGIDMGAPSGRATESGGILKVPVRLTKKPVSTVKVIISTVSDNPADDSFSIAGRIMTFTPTNYNAYQNALISVSDDDVADGNTGFSVTAKIAVDSPDTLYLAPSVPLAGQSVLDNDTAGYIVTTDGSPSENGDATQVSIRLTSQPDADVTISATHSNLSEAVLPQNVALTFNQTNWSANQKFLVRGLDDDIDDGDQPFFIAFSVDAGGETTGYATEPLGNLNLTNLDNDTSGVTADISGNLSESGSVVTLGIGLSSEPLADVSITLSLSLPDEANLSANQLNFTPQNWNVPQTVSVSGLNDDVDDGDQLEHIRFAVNSVDAAYGGIAVDDIILPNADDDTAGFSDALISGDLVEGGSTLSISVGIHTQPFSSVRITPAYPGHFSAGSISPAYFEFNQDNWTTRAVFTLSSPEDDIATGHTIGNVTFTVDTSDGLYANLTPEPLQIQRRDIDSAEVIVQKIDTTLGESGASASFSVKLNSKPLSPVTLNMVNQAKDEADLLLEQITIAPENWANPVNVTLTGKDDNIADGNQPVNISFAITGGDGTGYEPSLSIADISFLNEDDDTAGIVASQVSGRVEEGGTAATFTVRLTSEPSSPTTVNLASSSSDHVILDPLTVLFDAGNWNQEIPVRISAIDDDEPRRDFTVVLTASVEGTGSTSEYAKVLPATTNTVVFDNESPWIILSSDAGYTDENGSATAVKVRLSRQPTDEVALNFSVSDPSEGIVKKNAVSLDSGNWDTGLEIYVEGVNDDIRDNRQKYFVRALADPLSVPEYSGVTAALALVNLDNDMTQTQIYSILPADNTEFSVGDTVEFFFKTLREPDSDDMPYDLIICANAEFINCEGNFTDIEIKEVADDADDDEHKAGWIPFLPLLLLPLRYIRNKKRTCLGLLFMMLLITPSCIKSTNSLDDQQKSSEKLDVLTKTATYQSQLSITKTGVYYWKVVGNRGGEVVESPVKKFFVR